MPIRKAPGDRDRLIQRLNTLGQIIGKGQVFLQICFRVHAEDEDQVIDPDEMPDGLFEGRKRRIMGRHHLHHVGLELDPADAPDRHPQNGRQGDRESQGVIVK